MALRLKTKFTLATALLVLAVMAVISAVYLATLTRQVVAQAQEAAVNVVRQVFFQAQHALEDAASQGAGPVSESPADLREYVRKALDEDAGLSSLVEAVLAFSPAIYEVTITDHGGVALVSSDASLVGHLVPDHPKLSTLVASGVFDQLRVLYGPHRVYVVTYPFNLGGQPFGEIRVGLSTALWRNEVSPRLGAAGLLALGAVLVATLLAAAVSHASLRPLARISAQLDRISHGEFEVEPLRGGDELGQVSTKINLIGQQLRGVREIFSTLRENLDQIMGGLEDGLLLFTRDGRAVLASPSVEKFLGVKPDQLLGHSVSEIFPPDHPLRRALPFRGDQLEPVEAAEVYVDGAAGQRGGVERIGVSVQVVAERAGDPAVRMGTLVMLRDLDSLDRLGSQLQVSERMAALGRVTAGVAHEVKNPLNSMRLWLENLKESLSNNPPGSAGAGPSEKQVAQEAVRVLDSEIDRLDRVVKTFLDFTRPVELKLEETRLGGLLEEVLAIARPQAERAHVEFAADLPATVPVVRVDRALLKQAVLNLVLNACEAMPDGGRLTVSLRRRADNAEVSVADTGRGISPEHHGKIFSLFFTTQSGGSGIGLATTFRIVQLHNGSIDFESEVGRGTTFRIELPLAR